MGCPAPKVTKNGDGSALLKDLDKIDEILQVATKVSNKPITVKFRIGYYKNENIAVEVAKICEKNNVSAITVHGRTKEQMYLPGIDLSVIADVKNAVKVPVVGNGDIYTASDAKRMLSETGCDGVMVARGALGNPWIFSEITAALENDEYKEPTAAERLFAAKELLSMMIADKGERIGCAEAKKQIAWFIRDISGAAASRSNVMTAQTSTKIHEILDELIACN
jgi:tRNA-dihydrouridine synthase B